MKKTKIILPNANESCVPCHKGSSVAPATRSEIKSWRIHVPGWRVVNKKGIPTLQRAFKFKVFKDALRFAVKLAAISETQEHHPDVLVQWGLCTVEWRTHSIKNLHRNDFIMAGKTDRLYRSL